MATSSTDALMKPEAGTNPKKAANIYQFNAYNIDGELVDLSVYKGQVCLIINVASKWGKTDASYRQLKELFDKYSSDENGGLKILAFPCNQFGHQEPGTNEEIKKFAQEKYGAKYDLFAKIDVNFSKEHPLYTYLKAKQGGTLVNAIKWNFSKFVVDREGVAVARFSPGDDLIPTVEECLKKYLKAK